MPKSNEGNGRFTVTLPRAVIEQLDAIAAERGVPRAILMREAALSWLKGRPPMQKGRVA